MTRHGYRLIETINSFPIGRGISAELQIGKDWASLPDYLRQPQLGSRTWPGKCCFLPFTLKPRRDDGVQEPLPRLHPVDLALGTGRGPDPCRGGGARSGSTPTGAPGRGLGACIVSWGCPSQEPTLSTQNRNLPCLSSGGQVQTQVPTGLCSWGGAREALFPASPPAADAPLHSCLFVAFSLGLHVFSVSKHLSS